MLAAIILVFWATNVQAEFYHTFTGEQISPARWQQFQFQNLVPYCAIEIKECDPDEPRRIDYSCNNLRYPQRGTTFTPFRRMLPPEFGINYEHRPGSSGNPLPGVRPVRTSILPDGRIPSKHYTHLVTNALVFITGDITSVHDTINYIFVTTTCCLPGGNVDPRCDPIYVPDDDVFLRRSSVRCLNLTKPITYQNLGCAPISLPPERINTSPPMLELSTIYGATEPTARMARQLTSGLLRVEIVNGREWPPNGALYCVQNQVPRETRCHATPALGGNIIIGAVAFNIWLTRNHNRMARELQKINPCWDDDRLYREAKEVSIAYMNQIWYYELMPALLGYDFLIKNEVIFETPGHINDYDEELTPQLSIEYAVGSRWFHTMQEGSINKYDRNGKLLHVERAVELTLRTGILPLNRTLEGLTQGFFRQPSGEADHTVDPDMSERVLGGIQFASDVSSSDLQKGRAVGLPPYVKYRKICGLKVPRNFDDLQEWMPVHIVDVLRFLFEKVEDIDLMAGIMSEKRMADAAVGPTLACVMVDQLRRWRRADRFWFENNLHPGSYNLDQLNEIRKMSLSKLICENGDDVDSIQPQPLLLPGHRNEITDCKHFPSPSLKPWFDPSCGVQKKSTFKANNSPKVSFYSG